MTANNANGSDHSDHEEERVILPDSCGTVSHGMEGFMPAMERTQVTVDAFFDPSHIVPELKRFKIKRLLGVGGMGKVYDAYDPKLKRRLAVKLMHHRDKEHQDRFAREARLQAQVNHPNVCQVYEVGEEDGVSFIAMQLIRGRTLDKMLHQLDLRMRIRALADAAEGVHEAHRTGLIHRDLKPGNIMIETREGGGRHAYVLDFGIARSMEAPDLTLTGVMLGTPRYMSPEQALGITQVDQRCDVYSLGATLYFLINEESPYSKLTLPAMLGELQERDARPLSQLKADLPSDLVTICRKAMAREPDERYDSARAFAEDLHRFLDDKPILASPPSLAYQLRKMIQRNKPLFVAVTLAFCILAGSLIYNVLAIGRAEQREQLVQNYTRRVERMNALHRQIMLSQAHDVRPGLALFREEMHAIREDMDGADEGARLVAMQALGRAHLTLSEYEEARDLLQTVWDRGEHSGQTAYALGLTLARLYDQQRRVEMIQAGARKRDPDLEALKERLQEPALRYLARCRNEPMIHAQVLEAEISYTQGAYKHVLTLLDEKNKRPWLYESDVLRGNALRELGNEAMDRGDGVEAAQFRARALEAYDQALGSAGSDPRVYLAKAELRHYYAALGGLDVENAGKVIDLALADTNKALLVKPDFTPALQMALNLRLTFAKLLMNDMQIKGNQLADILVTLQTLFYELPEQTRNYVILADIHYTQARLLSAQGESPVDALDAALEALGKTLEEERNRYYHATSGLVRLERVKATGTPEDEELAIQALVEALRLESDSLFFTNNLGLIYLNRGLRLEGDAQNRAFSEAIRSFERAEQLGPDHFLPAYYLGRVYYSKGKAALKTGGDAVPDFNKAVAHYQRGSSLNSKMFQFPNAEGNVYISLAQALFEQGGDWRVPLAECYRALTKAAGLAPNSAVVFQNRAIAYQMDGFYRCRTGQNPTEVLDRCVTDIQHARALSDMAYFPYLHAQVELVRAEWALKKGEKATDALNNANRLLDEAFEMKPDYKIAWRGRGSALLLQALALEQQGGDPQEVYRASLQAFSQGENSLINQLDHARAAAYYAKYLLTSNSDASMVLDMGLKQILEVRKQKPDLAEGRVIHHVLTMLRGQEPTPQTVKDLEDAFHDNANLMHEWNRHHWRSSGQ